MGSPSDELLEQTTSLLIRLKHTTLLTETKESIAEITTIILFLAHYY
jgi:hypothetical protein